MINDGLIVIFNKLLDLNPGSKSELAKYAGKSLLLNIIGVQLKAVINQDGLFEPCTSLDNNEISAIMVIPVSGAIYLVNLDKLELFKQIKITGDKNFARTFLEILAKLNLNGVYAKVSPLEGILIKQVAKLLSVIKQYIIRLNANTSLSIAEYLQYETGDIINRHKINTFCNEVDEIKARVDLLEKHVQKANLD